MPFCRRYAETFWRRAITRAAVRIVQGVMFVVDRCCTYARAYTTRGCFMQTYRSTFTLFLTAHCRKAMPFACSILNRIAGMPSGYRSATSTFNRSVSPPAV